MNLLRPYCQRPMHSLPGISPTRTSAPSHRAVVPPGQVGLGETSSYRASTPAGAGDVHWTQTTTTPYSTFCIHHSTLSYTFSAKERDPETGLSYFGSRYYSSDLSIWLSVDPMSDKYASLSPYVYCADNPVNLVDPNGDSIINGYKYAYDYFLQQYNLAEEKYRNLDNNRESIEYSNVKNEYDKASQDLKNVSVLYKTTEAAISNVKKYNKQLYHQMNNIKDDKGNAVDIIVSINYSIGKYGKHSIPILPVCPTSISVQLNPNVYLNEYKDMGEVLSHEFGHLLYIIPNWSDYQKFLKTVNPNRHDGHDHDDPSGQEAHKQTQTYILNKIKQP